MEKKDKKQRPKYKMNNEHQTMFFHKLAIHKNLLQMYFSIKIGKGSYTYHSPHRPPKKSFAREIGYIQSEISRYCCKDSRTIPNTKLSFFMAPNTEQRKHYERKKKKHQKVKPNCVLQIYFNWPMDTIGFKMWRKEKTFTILRKSITYCWKMTQNNLTSVFISEN